PGRASAGSASPGWRRAPCEPSRRCPRFKRLGEGGQRLERGRLAAVDDLGGAVLDDRPRAPVVVAELASDTAELPAVRDRGLDPSPGLAERRVLVALDVDRQQLAGHDAALSPRGPAMPMPARACAVCSQPWTASAWSTIRPAQWRPSISSNEAP